MKRFESASLLFTPPNSPSQRSSIRLGPPTVTGITATPSTTVPGS
ncbi:unnamed protein product, partial [Protopolystoma xenopodis]